MADNDAIINGDSSEFLDIEHASNKTSSAVDDDDSDAVNHLNQRIGVLEREISESAERIGELKAELDRSESATAAIAKRASELEGEVARLQHDLITAMNDDGEANSEIQTLKAKIRDLEEKAMREKKERDREIDSLRREKKAAEESVDELQELLNDSKVKVRAMEEKMGELLKKSQESENVVVGLMEKVAEREREAAIDEQSKGFKELKTQLPLVGAVSAGAVVAAMAVCYFRYSRNR